MDPGILLPLPPFRTTNPIILTFSSPVLPVTSLINYDRLVPVMAVTTLSGPTPITLSPRTLTIVI